MYGNYTNSSIANLLNYKNKLNRNKEWTTKSINKVINENFNYIYEKDTVTELLYMTLSGKKITIASIKKLYKEINGYNMNITNIPNIKYRKDILIFLNKYNVNFKIWNYDEIEPIENYYITNSDSKKRIKDVEEECDEMFCKKLAI